MIINDTPVEAIILAVDENDNVVDELEGIVMVF